MARGVRGMEGARDAGASGFAKGVGKGLFGAVIRSVSGTVDLASGTLNAIKTCVSGSQYTEPALPKRFIHGDKIIRPYNHQESAGYKYIKDTENGFYLSSDSYVGHARLSDKAVLLTTDKRILLSNKNSVLVN
uniref:Uncharacterized protein n=1 Tax=Rhabditophanes sp. KR3021 TaxID=114890 RepID=A0AC35UCP0_9BILA